MLLFTSITTALEHSETFIPFGIFFGIVLFGYDDNSQER